MKKTPHYRIAQIVNKLNQRKRIKGSRKGHWKQRLTDLTKIPYSHQHVLPAKPGKEMEAPTRRSNHKALKVPAMPRTIILRVQTLGMGRNIQNPDGRLEEAYLLHGGN